MPPHPGPGGDTSACWPPGFVSAEYEGAHLRVQLLDQPGEDGRVPGDIDLVDEADRFEEPATAVPGSVLLFPGGEGGGGGGVRGGALLCSGQHRGHDLKLLHGRKAPQLPPKPKRSAYLQAHILVSRQPTPARSGVGDQRPGKATLYTKYITRGELYGCSEESDMCTQQYKLLK